MSVSSVGRPRLLGLLVSALALWLVAGCAGSGQEEEEKKGAPPVAGSFVGITSDPETFVAVVADEPGQGEQGREVRAYLCDGETINEWFMGSASANELEELSSANGARLEGELVSDRASGTIHLPDGTRLPFEASPARGVAGLYDVTLSSDGRLSGASEDGAELEGRLLGDTPQEDGSYRLSATITPPGGSQPEAFDEVFVSPDASGELRWIVLEDGRVKGGPKRREGTGFIDPATGE